MITQQRTRRAITGLVAERSYHELYGKLECRMDSVGSMFGVVPTIPQKRVVGTVRSGSSLHPLSRQLFDSRRLHLPNLRELLTFLSTVRVEIRVL